MSKELEALNYLVCLAVVGNKENHRGKIFDSEEIVLKALKRNEPMKVTTSISGRFKCPKCTVVFTKRHYYTYCPACGQAIDWSDEK